MKRRTLIQSAAMFGAVSGAAHAQQSKPIRLGALIDLSGPYSDVGGKTHPVAFKLALEDFGSRVLGRPVELLIADFQQKVDISMSLARNWIDREAVDVILDAPNSSVALSVQTLVAERNKVYLSGAFATALTGKDCTKNSARFVTSAYPLGTVPATALVKQGKKSWYFVTVDYALGHSIEGAAIDAVKKNGGTVLGSVRHPFGTADFSSYLLEAQASKAEVIAFSSAGSDLENALKQAQEFGLTKAATISALDLRFLGVPSSGLALLQGAFVADTFYWEDTPATLAFSKRFMDATGGTAPGSSDAGSYTGLVHCLKAMQATGTSSDGRTIVAKMKEMPVEGLFAPGSRVSAGGQFEPPVSLFRVKTPAESKSKWDVYTRISEVEGEAAWGNSAASACAPA